MSVVLPGEPNARVTREASRQVIARHAALAAGALLIPIPLADSLSVTAVQLEMCRALARLHRRPENERELSAALASIVGRTAQRETDHQGHEKDRITDQHDGHPRAHDETSNARERARDGVKSSPQAVACLPRLREARGEAKQDVAVLSDAKVTAVLADERVQRRLGIAKGEAAPGGCIGDGDDDVTTP